MIKKPVIVYDTQTNQVSEFESVSEFHSQINYNRCNLTEHYILDRYITFEKNKLFKYQLNIDYISLPKRFIQHICKDIIDSEKQKILNTIYDTFIEKLIYVYNSDNKLLGEFKNYQEVADYLKIPLGTVKSRLFRNKTEENYFKGTLITYRKK